MNAAAALALALQIVQLAPDLIRATAAIKELYEMITDGKEPTQAEIDALLERVKSNSAVIADIAAKDEQTA